jgi:geranylgeranyl reductase family protein
MSRRFDAVVVGAGPAGSAAARDIAAAGHRVLLLEEHARIGEPLHCSGLVTPRTLDIAGIDQDIVLNRINGATINLPSGRRVPVGGTGPYAFAIDRVRFDEELVEQAQARGAQLRTGSKLTGIERDCGGSVKLCIRHDGTEEQIETRLLVGADGAQSFVARWLGARSEPRETLVGVSVVAELATERQDYAEVFVGHSIAPGFFGWLIPLGDGSVRIGIATNDGRRPIHYLRDLINAFPDVFAGAKFGRFFGGLIPLSHVPRPVGDNVMLVGDAAGQVKPTSGGGIYSGLVGAKHCAVVANEALTTGDLSRGFLERYAASWQSELGEEFERMQDLRRIFLSLGDADLERLAQLLLTPRLQDLIARHGDIDFPSSILLRLAKAAPALLSFVKVGLRFPWHRLIGTR